MAKDSRGRAIAVTVVIPTFNGDRYLGDVLDAIAGQRFEGAVETLVIDSGSADDTLEIVRSRAGVRLHQIPNSEFGHGRTRNLGARMASGELVAFLTQDAIPAHRGWLQELTAPLHDPRVGGVVGRQVARPGCFPAMKYDIAETFAALGPADSTTLEHLPAEEDRAAIERATFYSDVNAASRRAFLVDVVPYRDVAYSEDTAFAHDLLAAGYAKAYAGRALVIHSNDVTRREYRKRIFDETLSLRRIGALPRPHGPLARVLRWGWQSLRDSARILRDPEFGFIQTVGWLVRNPAYLAARWQGYAQAIAVNLDDDQAARRFSLEAERAPE